MPDTGEAREAAARSAELAAADGDTPVMSPDLAQDGDLPPCPGINPDIRRPAGSNCLGIVPEACGADRLDDFVGRLADADTRRAVEALVATDDIRWIRPGDAVIEDLRADRLNLELDAEDRIETIDCC